ncbi:MAG: hypothetical protein ACTSQA_07345, partial [Candidatus Heimdallarchaeaceae archaeon]
YIAPLVYSKDPTIDTPDEVKSTLKNLLQGLDEDLLDNWVLSLVEENVANESKTITSEVERERKKLEELALQEEKMKKIEIDGVSENILREFLSDIDSIEF